jgi:hypothetical protein
VDLWELNVHVVLPVGVYYLADLQTGCKEKQKDLV